VHRLLQQLCHSVTLVAEKKSVFNELPRSSEVLPYKFYVIESLHPPVYPATAAWQLDIFYCIGIYDVEVHILLNHTNNMEG